MKAMLALRVGESSLDGKRNRVIRNTVLNRAKNLLLGHVCGKCEYLKFVFNTWDGDYAICMKWFKNKVGVDEKDFTYMDDNICHYFSKADKEEINRRIINNEWRFKRDQS